MGISMKRRTGRGWGIGLVAGLCMGLAGFHGAGMAKDPATEATAKEWHAQQARQLAEMEQAVEGFKAGQVSKQEVLRILDNALAADPHGTVRPRAHELAFQVDIAYASEAAAKAAFAFEQNRDNPQCMRLLVEKRGQGWEETLAKYLREAPYDRKMAALTTLAWIVPLKSQTRLLLLQASLEQASLMKDLKDEEISRGPRIHSRPLPLVMGDLVDSWWPNVGDRLAGRMGLLDQRERGDVVWAYAQKHAAELDEMLVADFKAAVKQAKGRRAWRSIDRMYYALTESRALNNSYEFYDSQEALDLLARAVEKEVGEGEDLVEGVRKRLLAIEPELNRIRMEAVAEKKSMSEQPAKR
jgi:hypothetical protein